MRCSNCNCEILEGNFCPECGCPLSDTVSPFLQAGGDFVQEEYGNSAPATQYQQEQGLHWYSLPEESPQNDFMNANNQTVLQGYQSQYEYTSNYATADELENTVNYNTYETYQYSAPQGTPKKGWKTKTKVLVLLGVSLLAIVSGAITGYLIATA